MNKRIKKCSFYGCNITSKTSPSVKFFQFPKYDTAQWLEACKNPKLTNLSHQNLQYNYYVCSKHFHRNDFTKVLTPFKNKLKQGVVPREQKETEFNLNNFSFTGKLNTSLHHIG